MDYTKSSINSFNLEDKNEDKSKRIFPVISNNNLFFLGMAALIIYLIINLNTRYKYNHPR